ncbi:MAG: VTT domain-containing protein [Bryobacteraceae bacterium]
MEELVRHYGYWMVAAGTVVEGNATVITASFLAHRGYLNLLWVCALACFVTVVENVGLYELARRRGGSLAEGTSKTALHIQTVLGWVRTRGALLLFASRFIFGIRSAAALACGIAKMPRGLFLWTNLAGAVAWTAVMAIAGYSGGHLFSILVADVRRHEWTVAAAVAATVTVTVLWKSHGSDVVDVFGAAFIIEGWPTPRLLQRKKKTSR